MVERRAGRRAPPVRARSVGVPRSGPRRRPAGADPPSRDRDRRRGGAGGAAPDVRRCGCVGRRPAVRGRPGHRLRRHRHVAGRRGARRPGVGAPTSPTTPSPSPAPTWPDPAARSGTRVRLAGGRWFEALPDALRGRVDLIVATRPTSPRGRTCLPPWPTGSRGARWCRAPTGLEAIDEVVTGAPAWLPGPGALVVEVAPTQAPAAVRWPARPGWSTSRSGRPGRPAEVLVARAVGRGWGRMNVVIVACFGEPPPASAIQQAVAALADGRPVGMPTDTVYGLAADPFVPAAADRIFEAKRRPRDVNLPVLVADLEQALAAGHGGARVRAGADGTVLAWPPHRRPPGPDRGWAPTWATTRPPSACAARPTPCPWLCAGPSARWQRRAPTSTASEPLTTAAQVAAAFGDAVPVVLDAGACAEAPRRSSTARASRPSCCARAGWRGARSSPLWAEQPQRSGDVRAWSASCGSYAAAATCRPPPAGSTSQRPAWPAPPTWPS